MTAHHVEPSGGPSPVDRRGFLVSLPALALAPTVLAQGAKPQLKTRGINHVKLIVADLKRSIDFYQALFAMPVQSRTGSTDAARRIGSAPQHLALSNDAAATPSTERHCPGVDGCNADQGPNALPEPR